MINEISIKNFKCFEKITITNIPKILLIGGKNNTGKSTL